MSGLERDLVAQCRDAAARMNCYLVEIGQRDARRSGTTKGCVDLIVVEAGQVVLVEAKRGKTKDTPRGRLRPDQVEFIRRCADQGVEVPVVDRLADFIEIVNGCRRHARGKP